MKMCKFGLTKNLNSGEILKTGIPAQENAFKKRNSRHLFLKLKAQILFTPIENHLKFLKMAMFEFKVIIHYGLWGGGTPSCDPLTSLSVTYQ